ncbi:hypothetical protein ACFE04_002651 [Oxalis oulophora]
MNLVHYASTFSTVRLFNQQRHSSSRTPPRRQRIVVTRSSVLPFSIKEVKYYKELEAAVDVVQTTLSSSEGKIIEKLDQSPDVQTTLSSSEGKIIEKLDQSPVTVADFGVQALISLVPSSSSRFPGASARFPASPRFRYGDAELIGKLFPSIPLVAEEDSAFIRANNLVGPVVSVVTENTRFDGLTQSEVLEAIDRGGKDGATFGPKPATYWLISNSNIFVDIANLLQLLDPIDGTRRFVQGEGALYVEHLSLQPSADMKSDYIHVRRL